MLLKDLHLSPLNLLLLFRQVPFLVQLLKHLFLLSQLDLLLSLLLDLIDPSLDLFLPIHYRLEHPVSVLIDIR